MLPFANRSADKENEFFTDGMHEDILTQLSKIRELQVTSRTSVEQYRGTKKTLKQVGEELGVAYILEGSVQRSVNKVRVTGQLIRAATDEHLWAQNYDRDLTATDIFAIQSELAQAIAGEMKANISPREKTQIEYRPTEKTLAYDLYLKTRETKRDFIRTANREDQRIAALTAVVGLDPTFAIAWAELGAELAYASRRDYSHPAETLLKAKNAIETAVRLAPDLPDVQVALGRYHQFAFNNYAEAARCFEDALQQNPNDALVHFALGQLSRVQGRLAAAVTHLRRALQLDPENGQYLSVHGDTLEAGRRFDEASEVRRRRMLTAGVARSYALALLSFQASGSTREMVQLFSGLTEAEAKSNEVLTLRRSWAIRTGDLTEYVRLAQATPRPPSMELALVLAAKGDLAAARAELGDSDSLRSALEKEPTNPGRWSALGMREAVLGHGDEALRCARKAMELRPESLSAPFGPRYSAGLAFVYAWTGDKDRAIAEIARLLRVPFSGLNVHEMKRHPAYHPLRGDPRFEALLNDPKNNAPLF